MTVAERKGMVRGERREYVVRVCRDREAIRALLETKRPYAAYALGQLDARLFRLAQWWTSEADGARALLLHSRGGLGNAVFTMGEAGALEALLRVHPGPRGAFLTCELHHIDTVERYFELSSRQTMIRMLVTRDTFTPSGGPARRLAGRDAREINRLYHSDGVPSFYSSRQIEDSVYYGVEEEGELVAIAGTHVISGQSSIAVVGNVYTHPIYRNRHYAQATTSAVTAKLLAACGEVVLSVDPTNAPAVRAYERLGYREVARLVEGAAVRRDGTGLAGAWRRIGARVRGRGAGGEVVRL